jgi:hypothetical protein
MNRLRTHGNRLPAPLQPLLRRILGSRALGLVFLLGLVLAGLSGAVRQAAAASSEYQVKAAFLYNFMKFVEWPGERPGGAGTLTLGIIGKDPFGAALEDIRGKSAKGRRVVVIHLHGVDEVKECDLLFVSASEKGRLPQILKAAQSYPVLTVGDQEGFSQAGGMINLVFVNNRVGFDVSVSAASRARLRISSQLLRLARTVVE